MGIVIVGGGAVGKRMLSTESFIRELPSTDFAVSGADSIVVDVVCVAYPATFNPNGSMLSGNFERFFP